MLESFFLERYVFLLKVIPVRKAFDFTIQKDRTRIELFFAL